MARLLVVHHTPSPATDAMLRAVVEGAAAPGIGGVETVTTAALTAGAAEVLEADGYILGTPANLGYMSGALKHFFDTIYYPCLEETGKRPYGLYLHGNSDIEGARVAIERIVTGLRWRAAHEPVGVLGEPDATDLEACWDLGATLAAVLSEDT